MAGEFCFVVRVILPTISVHFNYQRELVKFETFMLRRMCLLIVPFLSVPSFQWPCHSQSCGLVWFRLENVVVGKRMTNFSYSLPNTKGKWRYRLGDAERWQCTGNGVCVLRKALFGIVWKQTFQSWIFTWLFCAEMTWISWIRRECIREDKVNHWFFYRPVDVNMFIVETKPDQIASLTKAFIKPRDPLLRSIS